MRLDVLFSPLKKSRPHRSNLFIYGALNRRGGQTIYLTPWKSLARCEPLPKLARSGADSSLLLLKMIEQIFSFVGAIWPKSVATGLPDCHSWQENSLSFLFCPEKKRFRIAFHGGRALFWCPNGSVAESGEGHMGNVGLR